MGLFSNVKLDSPLARLRYLHADMTIKVFVRIDSIFKYLFEIRMYHGFQKRIAEPSQRFFVEVNISMHVSIFQLLYCYVCNGKSKTKTHTGIHAKLGSAYAKRGFYYGEFYSFTDFKKHDLWIASIVGGSRDYPMTLTDFCIRQASGTILNGN